MPATDEMEFDLLVRRARDAGFFVQRHKNYDPCREGGDLYLMPRRNFPAEHVESLLTYTTADEIHKFLTEVAA
jgi:hypothetical protein